MFRLNREVCDVLSSTQSRPTYRLYKVRIRCVDIYTTRGALVMALRPLALMALRPSARGHAPLVAYVDLLEFDFMCERMHDAYRELIATAVYSRRKSSPQCAELESQRAVMLLGAAEYHDMREGGLRILLSLTKGNGVEFCTILNDDIISAVTTSSRTYVSTIRRLCLLNTNITFRINMEDMIAGMRDAVEQWCGHSNTHAGRIGADLFVQTSSRGARWRLHSRRIVRCRVFPSLRLPLP